MSARIGEGDDNYNTGIISAFNDKAGEAGIKVDMPVIKAAKRMLIAKNTFKQSAGPFVMHEDLGGRIILTDTIAYLTDGERRSVVVGGSHCAHTTYEFVKDLELKGIFLNDAGKGKDNAGISGLHLFQEASIPAGAIDCMTAMIGNSRDAWENGIISAVNRTAQTHGIAIGMPIQKAALKLL